MKSIVVSLARSLAAMLATLFVASIAIFLLLSLMPGDPATYIASRAEVRPDPESIELVRHEFGLDRPLPIQYVDWLSDAVRGDLSRSWLSNAPVRDLIFARMGPSLLLGSSILVLSTFVTTCLGGLAAIAPGGVVDGTTRLVATLGTAIPSYLLALLAIRLFAVQLGVGTIIGDGTLRTLPLPAAVGTLGLTAFWIRPFRSLVADALATDWAIACRARGASNARLLVAHALPNALVGFMPFLGLGLAGVLAGSLLIENVFAWPGVGPFVVDSIKRRDLPVIQGFALITVTFYVVTTHLTDGVSRALDPNRRPPPERWS